MTETNWWLCVCLKAGSDLGFFALKSSRNSDLVGWFSPGPEVSLGSAHGCNRNLEMRPRKR